MRATATMLALAYIAVAGTAAAAAAAKPTVSFMRRDVTPGGPTDAGISSYCTYYDEARSQSDNCDYLETAWGLTHEDFVTWNPAFKTDCSGLVVGHSYCVEVNHGQPIPTTTTSVPTALPSPTQDGLVKDCKAFYLAKKGDTCDKIVQAFGTFTLTDFVKWNPAIGSDCSGLWAAYYYCVGIPGTPSTKPTITTTTKAPTGPSPTQTGIIKTCKKYYQAVSGDTCSEIVDKYKGTFTLSDFIKWNPAVGSDCSLLLAQYYYCVGIPGTPTSKTVTKTTSTKAPTNTCNPKAPQPTQPGVVCHCKKWHLVKDGTTCDGIISYDKIKASDFYKWNPKVGTECKYLWKGYYVCVGV